MDKEQLKIKCDITKIEEREFDNFDHIIKEDYIIDDKGNAILRVSPLHFKLIEKILDLEARIDKLEKGVK